MTSEKNGYELRAIKEAGGDETPRFDAKLLRDGKVIAVVSNEGCGGCNRYDYLDRGAEAPFQKFAAEWGRERGYNSEPDDMWVYAQMDAAEERRTLRRWSKKYTCYRLKGDKAGSWRRINRPFSDDMRERIIKTHGDKVEAIFNPTAEANV